MRSAHISLHGCIRAHKQAWALTGLGLETHLLSSRIAPTHSTSSYTTVQLWNANLPEGGWDDRQLKNAVKLIDKHVDLYHVHNEPNWMFRVVREITDKPVLFDIHDWTSIRNDPKQADEIKEEEFALRNASGFVVPSLGYLNKIRSISTRPSIQIHSKVLGMFYPKNTVRSRPGVVFEGGVQGKKQYFDMNYDYRNWSTFAKEAVQKFGGEKFYLYSANTDEDFEEYKDEKIEIFPPQIYPDLIAQMSTHSCGLVGTPYPLPDFQDSMPNKLFEYVAAGIPCLVLNSPEAQRYVEQNGLGMGISSASEVYDAMQKVKELRVDRERWKHTMESEISALAAFYEEVCRKRKISQI